LADRLNWCKIHRLNRSIRSREAIAVSTAPTKKTAELTKPRVRTRRTNVADRSIATVADLLKSLGDIPAERVRWNPLPGRATERDLLRTNERKEGAICELVDGTLVEKPMGFGESELAIVVASAILLFVRERKLGIVVGEAGMLRLKPGLVRVPDVSFVSWDRLPGRKRSSEPIPALAPDLAVEVLSKSNTKAEIERKLNEYFEAGTSIAWIVDPKKKTVRVHTSADTYTTHSGDDILDGGAVLPGFRLPLKEIFELEEG
jgi:Uma2 family endonuclease